MQLTIKPNQLNAVLETCLKSVRANPKTGLVPFIAAAPGIGKSTIVRQFANDNQLNFIDTRLSYCAPTDVRGFPYIDRSDASAPTMKFATPADYPRTPGNVWLWDEYTLAPKAVQNVSLQATLDKVIGDYRIPDDTLVVLAGNRSIDRANVERLGSAAQNRIMEITLETDHDEWTTWGLNNNVHEMVIAYLQMCPGHLSDFDGSKWKGGAFASPRSWEMVSNLLRHAPSDTGVRMVMIAGLVGQAVGTQFNAFCSVYDNLPDVNAILLSPDTADVPSEPSVQYALATALANKSTVKNFDRVLRYTDRMPKAIDVLTVKLAIRGNQTGPNSPVRNPAFTKWANTNGNIILGVR
jgi:hypothetical protein